jgi:hypothetical protein
LRAVSNESISLKVFDRGCVRVGCEPSRFGIRGMMSEDRKPVFAFMPTDSPAAIRRLGTTGKAPV